MFYRSWTITFLFVFVVEYQNITSAPSPYYSDSSKYDIKSYLLDLKMSHENTIISGFASIYASSTQDSLSIFYIELNPELKISKIFVNNTRCTFTRYDKWLRVKFPFFILIDSLFSCSIHYSGEVSKITSMGGFKSEYMVSSQKHVTYTLSEPFGSYLWFPCKQELTDKADSTFMHITTKEGVKVVSNGLLKKVTRNNAKHEERFEWESHSPTAYYVISVALSEYNEYHYYIKNEANTDSILFQNYYFNSDDSFKQTKEDIDETVKIMHLYEKLLFDYPFKKEKYGHCIAPIGGGMENQTITMVNSFSFGLIAHELAHSWFGNMVTCSTWKDIWVNEGLTSYFEYLAYEFFKPEAAETWLDGAITQGYSEVNGTVVIPDDELENERRIFNYNLTYRKGAYVVHQFRQKLNNDSLFFEVLRTFLQRFAYSNASVQDFKKVAEEKTGISLDAFFNSWYYGFGMPKVHIFWKNENNILSLNLSQDGNSPQTPVFDVTYEIKVIFEDGADTILRINQQFADENINFSFPKKVIKIEKFKHATLLINSIYESSQIAYYDIKIYPNPAFDTLYIDFANTEKNRVAEIVSYSGQVFGSYLVSRRKNIINISRLIPGLYLIKVEGKKKASNIKFFKK